MQQRDFRQLNNAGVAFDLYTSHVSGRGWFVFYQAQNGHQDEVMTARGQRRFFRSLDAVYKFAQSVGADSVTARERLWEDPHLS